MPCSIRKKQADEAYFLSVGFVRVTLRHETEAPVPSLFTFSFADETLHALHGLVVASASVAIPATKFRSEDPLLITHWGMSDPTILKLSNYAAHLLADCQYRAPLSVSWVAAPEYDVQQRLWSYLLDKVQGSCATILWGAN